MIDPSEYLAAGPQNPIATGLAVKHLIVALQAASRSLRQGLGFNPFFYEVSAEVHLLI
jgi:hypothetical protein